jgi:phosphatidylinositol alpha-mannosyltransferase
MANVTTFGNHKEEALSLFRDGKYDLLHIHQPYAPFASWELLAELDIPKIVTFHDAWNPDSPLNHLDGVLELAQERFTQYVRGAVFVSRAAEACWSPLCGGAVLREVIPNGIGSEFITSHAKHSSGPVQLLFLSRLVPRKGIMVLLQALSILTQQDPVLELRLVVAGEGDDRSRAEKYVRQRDLGHIVTFAGEVTGAERLEVYRNADIFCAPYTDEAFGITILEGMASGCAITGFWNEGFGEMLDGYPAPSFITRQRSPEALAEAIGTAIREHPLREAAARWSVLRSKRFAWSRIAERTERLYHRVLQ